ncbi:MAG: hypothetical protein ACHRXM_27990 [Isosphaerales bacterium]
MTTSASPNEASIDVRRANDGPVKALLRLTETAQFLRSTDGRVHARVSIGGRPEIFALRSPEFRDWLIDGYSRTCGETPSDWSIRRVLARLEANARFQSDTSSVFIRVGHDGDANANANGNGNGSVFYLDLADPSGQAVKIGPDGWSVVNNPHVNFRRPDGHLPLPTPSREGAIELLRPYVNVIDRDFTLLVVWMAAALRPVGPYPVLALYGETGSAKTTTAKVVRLLIDPQATPMFAQPQNTRDLMAAAVNGWLLACDNISAIPDWLSDGLCMLSTAGAFAGHAPFTDGQRRVIHAQRPVILTGVEEFVRRGDLGDRSIFLDLPPIAPSDRRLETEFWASFHQDYPRILGGLLDAVVGGLRELPSLRLTELPRMADFAAFAEAIGRSLGLPPDTVLSNYNENRQEAAMAHLEDSPLAAILLENALDLDGWFGTPSKLLDLLTSLAGRAAAASPRWPKSPTWLAIELRRIAPQLRLHGILVRSARGNRGRILSIQRDHSVDRKNHDMRNFMADEQLRREPNNTPEESRHAQVQVCQEVGEML